jgi:DNA-binding CsgD family transcriptional regulator
MQAPIAFRVGKPMLEIRRAALLLVDELQSTEQPADVLNALQRAVSPLGLSVLTTFRVPRHRRDPNNYILNGNTFYHESVHPRFPSGYLDGAREHGGPSVLAQMAWLARMPFTFGECLRRTHPIGEDRWIFDLLRRCAMRDGIFCPSMDLWNVLFTSGRVLQLSHEHRSLLHFMASEAVGHLTEMVPRDKPRGQPRLTARELAVLGRIARGDTVEEISQKLGIAESTVDGLMTNAKKRLRAKSREHAVFKATRRSLLR